MARPLLCPAVLLLFSLPGFTECGAEPPQVLNVWPDRPPGSNLALPPEADTTKPGDNQIAGRPVIRLANVSTPTISVFRPDPEKDTGAAVVVCPGGGHHILAWDLEGTEVAEWLNSIGVTGIVLKYRVPFRNPERRWEAAVQDAQRAMSLVRSRADEWHIDPHRIGILGFSAGGETAALTALFGSERQYAAMDSIDDVSSRPEFAVLVYPGGLVERDNSRLRDHVRVTDDSPPMFLVHAFNDGVAAQHSLLLFLALKEHNVPSELHVYHTGGHGYGLRRTDTPVTGWPLQCEAWLRASRLLDRDAK
jgi:acetyl esterase/lipase